MNRVFKVIWNSALGRYDVASEFSKSGKKIKSFCSGAETVDTTLGLTTPSRLNQIAITLMFTLGTNSAFAADISVPGFTPEVQFEQISTANSQTKCNKVTHRSGTDKIAVLTLSETLLHEGKTFDSA